MVVDPESAPTALNCAPDAESFRSVSELVQAFTSRWGGRPGWRLDTDQHPHEASHLRLDATCARALLGWRPLLSFEDAVTWTADWYRAFWNGDDVGTVTSRQIDAFSERLDQPAGDQMPVRGTA